MAGDEDEHPTRSFLVRVWIEERARPDRDPVWRGHVTDVASGQQRAVGRIDDLVRFLVEGLGVVGIRYRVHDRIRLFLLMPWRRR